MQRNRPRNRPLLQQGIHRRRNKWLVDSLYYWDMKHRPGGNQYYIGFELHHVFRRRFLPELHSHLQLLELMTHVVEHGPVVRFETRD